MTSPATKSASVLRRERLKAETRQAILDASRELFVSVGIEATTMRAIAARIGYTPTAIYHHFRDKEALIEELCVADFTALGQAMRRIGRTEDPVDRLLKLGMAYADFALSNPSQYRFMFMTQQRHGLVDDDGKPRINPGKDAYDFLLQTVTEAIQEDRLRPELDKPHEVAQMMWAGIHGVVSLWLTHAEDAYITWHPPRETVRTIVHVLIRGSLREQVN